MKTKIISVVNFKGGVGKTTTAANLGYALGKLGYDVLLVDFDPQASLTNYLNFGLRGVEYYGIHEMLVKELRGVTGEPDLDSMSFTELCDKAIVTPDWVQIRSENVGGKWKSEKVRVRYPFHLIPGSLSFSDYELELNNLPADKARNNIKRLAALLHKISEQYHEYDYILIDCNPSFGILTLNAVYASVNGVLIPTNLDLMSTRGVGSLIERITQVQSLMINNLHINHMGVIGVVLNLYSSRRTVDKTIQSDLERFYPFKIFKTGIPDSVEAKKATLAGKIYAKKYPKAEEAYLALAKEIVEQIGEMEKEGPQIRTIDEDKLKEWAAENEDDYENLRIVDENEE